MMNLMDHKMDFASLDQLECTMVELPYKGNRVLMQLILPRQRTGVFELENKLAQVDLQPLFSQNKRNVKVDLSLPRFKLSHSLTLSAIKKNVEETQELKANTVGLVTIGQMKQTQERARIEREKLIAMK